MHISNFCSKLFFVGFILTLSFGLRGQSNTDIKSLLSQSQSSKYQKAEKLIAKGSQIVIPADSLGVKEFHSSQAQRELNLKKEQAYLLLKDGYSMKLKVLKGYFEDYIEVNGNLSDGDKQKVIGIQSAVNEGIESSKKLYSQSRNSSRLSKSIKLQEDAQQIQLDAIYAAETGLFMVQSFKEPTAEKPMVATKDTLVKESVPVVEPAPVEPVAVVEVAAPVAAVVAVDEKEPEKVEEKHVEQSVYFSIQVLADKKAASLSQQKMVYKGSRKVIENVGAGWYRYSVGRFTSYSEAASVMKSEGIKGFVVAYNGDKRITTSEAKKILGGVK